MAERKFLSITFFFLIRALTSFESVYLLDLITSKRLHFLIHGDGGGGVMVVVMVMEVEG